MTKQKENISKLQALTIGNAVVDTNIVSTTFNKHNLHMDLKHPISNLSISVGGGALNAAATLAKLHFKTYPVCALGDDHYATFVAKQLAEKNIETGALVAKKTGSHQSTIISIPGQEEPLIFSYKNPHLFLDALDIPVSLVKESSLLYIASFEINSLSAVDAALSAVSPKCKIAFNPSSQIIEHRTAQVEHFLEKAHIIFMNQHEAELYMQKKNKPWNLHTFFNLVSSGKSKTVVLTLGKNGVHVLHENNLYSHPSISGSPVNTIGAGDAFNACFSGLLIQGYDVKTALLYGLYNSNSVIRQQTAQAGILSLEELKTHSATLNQLSISQMKYHFIF